MREEERESLGAVKERGCVICREREAGGLLMDTETRSRPQAEQYREQKKS